MRRDFFTKLPRSSFFLDASGIPIYIWWAEFVVYRSQCAEKNRSFSSRAKKINSREIYRLLKYWAQIEAGLTRSASCMQHATATALSLLLPTPNLGGGFEFSPAIVVCKIDLLKIVPFFFVSVGEREKKGVGWGGWGWFVSTSLGIIVCAQFLILLLGSKLWNMVFLCKKSAWEAMCFCFPPAGVIHSCFRNWVWFLDTFWKTCGGVLFKSWTVLRSKLLGWEIMWSEIQLGTVAGFSFVQELLF